MSTVKLGPDFGRFGANAILSRTNLIGSGAPLRATQANRVMLGHIGAANDARSSPQLAYANLPATSTIRWPNKLAVARSPGNGPSSGEESDGDCVIRPAKLPT